MMSDLQKIEMRLEELDKLGLSDSDEYRQLDERANVLAKQMADSQAEALARSKRDHGKKELIEDRGGLIALGYADFSEDYEIRQEGEKFVVYSHVALEGQESRHECGSRGSATAYLEGLLYDRAYNKYVRQGVSYGL